MRTIIALLLTSLTALATNIIPGPPGSPGNLGNSSHPFTNIYGVHIYSGSVELTNTPAITGTITNPVTTTGNITGAVVTATSGFYGSGANLTGLPASGATLNGTNTWTNSQTFLASTTISNNLTVTGTNTFTGLPLLVGSATAAIPTGVSYQPVAAFRKPGVGSMLWVDSDTHQNSGIGLEVNGVSVLNLQAQADAWAITFQNQKAGAWNFINNAFGSGVNTPLFDMTSSYSLFYSNLLVKGAMTANSVTATNGVVSGAAWTGGTNTAPVNAVTPVLWHNYTNNGNTYKVPLYQ